MISTLKRRSTLEAHTIWILAIPAILTNVATALIGLGDMWIVGQLNSAASQGAIELGARLFTILFVTMNFLKTGTTGLVAQAGSQGGKDAQLKLLGMGVIVAATISTLLLGVKPWLLPFLLFSLGANGQVLDAASLYAEIRYSAVPAFLLNLSLIGFLVGQRKITTALVVEITYNIVNICLGILLALKFDWGIAGIGWSSLIAEYFKLLILIALIAHGQSLNKALFKGHSWKNFKPFLAVNRDLFLRTLILIFTGAVLTRISAERGDVVLAANGIIYQVFAFTVLILDGFENSAQILNGERLGANDRKGFVRYIRAIIMRALLTSIILCLFLLLSADHIISEFSATKEVEIEALKLKWWLALLPVAGAVGFVLDGVFVGASWTRSLLLTMALASLVYFFSLWIGWPLGNWSAWVSMIIFLVVRATFQLVLLPRQLRKSFA